MPQISMTLVPFGLGTSVSELGTTSSGYKHEMGLRSVIGFPFVMTLTTAPRTWPSLLAITSVTLPNFHKLHVRGQCSSRTTTTSTIGDRGTPNVVYSIIPFPES